MTDSQLDPDRWFLRAGRRRNPRLTVLAVPWAGGGTASYHGLADLLPPDVDLWMLRLPGREVRRAEPLATSMAGLAPAAAAACTQALTGPFVLFGHSSGALIAFEVARRLRDGRGPEPALLAISAQPAPHLPPRYAPIHDLPMDRFLDALDERCHGVPAALRADREMQEVYVPAMRADVAVEETYRYLPEAPLECPVSAFGGELDTECRKADLQAWQVHTSAQFTVNVLPGDHFFFQTSAASLMKLLVEQAG
ncbi:thioesterase II family protein [Kitasatospora sp. NPDC056327]|uniref:thioesterase II family protein n=1 Tax=Kitasatospora sp. NPDC056327 TaxID=3345785 RepID=UPI0035D596BD